MKFSITAVKDEALRVVAKPAGADHIQRFKVHNDADIHIRIQKIRSGLDFFSDAFSLPGIPVRDMRKALAHELSVLIELPRFSAGVTDQAGSGSFHLPFLPAAGAFIEDPVQSVRAERRIDLHLILFLPGKVVEGKSTIQDRVDLFYRFFFHLFGREKTLQLSCDSYLSFLKIIVERISCERAIRSDHENGNSQRLKKHSHSSRKRSCRSVKRIARFRVHQHGDLIIQKRVFHVRDQGDIRDEFLRGNTAETSHQSFFSDKAI